MIGQHFYPKPRINTTAIIWIIGIFVNVGNLKAQAPLVVNNGSRIQLTQGAVMIVKDRSLHNNAGVLENAGRLTIEQDFLNAAIAGGANANSGNYRVRRNWINNGNFKADNSTVELYGANQLITGNAETRFYNLTLTGSGVKTQTIHAETAGTLALNTIELATDEFQMLVSNSEPNAITRTNTMSGGFVSSLGEGNLSRNMNQTQPYIFPTGSSRGTVRYRPIELTPSSTEANRFGVRFANVDPSSEGFDRNNNNTSTACQINELWYHRIYRQVGNASANVRIFYDINEGDFETIAHYANNWQGTQSNINAQAPFAGLSSLTKQGWDAYNPPAFALAKPCEKPEIAFEVPSVFTPNGDNLNDIFLPYNTNNIENYTLVIFDRWGSKVYEGNNSGWDGKKSGSDAPEGQYFYVVEIKYKGISKTQERTGGITLLR